MVIRTNKEKLTRHKHCYRVVKHIRHIHTHTLTPWTLTFMCITFRNQIPFSRRTLYDHCIKRNTWITCAGKNQDISVLQWTVPKVTTVLTWLTCQSELVCPQQAADQEMSADQFSTHLYHLWYIKHQPNFSQACTEHISNPPAACTAFCTALFDRLHSQHFDVLRDTTPRRTFTCFAHSWII